jgi:hypothetical protein
MGLEQQTNSLSSGRVAPAPGCVKLAGGARKERRFWHSKGEAACLTAPHNEKRFPAWPQGLKETGARQAGLAVMLLIWTFSRKLSRKKKR